MDIAFGLEMASLVHIHFLVFKWKLSYLCNQICVGHETLCTHDGEIKRLVLLYDSEIECQPYEYAMSCGLAPCTTS